MTDRRDPKKAPSSIAADGRSQVRVDRARPSVPREAPEYDAAAVSQAIGRKAFALYEQGDYAGAKDLFEQVTKRVEGLQGENSLELPYGLTTLGFLYRRLGDLERSHSCFSRALQIRLSGLGPFDVLTIESRNHLARSYHRLGRIDESKSLHLQSINHLDTMLGLRGWSAVRNDVLAALGSSLSSLGRVCYWTEDNQGADEALSRAITVREEVLGPYDLDLAEDYQTLGNSVFYTDMPRAKYAYERALAIREAVLDPTDPEVAESLHTLGCTFDKLSLAMPLLERALAIREQALPPDDLDVAESLEAVGSLHLKQGNAQTSRAMLERALSIVEAASGIEHHSYKSIQEKLKRLDDYRSIEFRLKNRPIRLMNLFAYFRLDNLWYINGRFTHKNPVTQHFYSSDIDYIAAEDTEANYDNLSERVRDAIHYAKNDSEKEAILSAIFNEALAQEGFSVTVKKTTDTLRLPEQAPRLWKDRTLGQNPQEFIASVYERWLGKGLTRQHIKQLDAPLYNAYAVYRHRHQHPDEEPPFDLPDKKETVSREIKDLSPEKIKHFRRLLSASHRRREP